MYKIEMSEDAEESVEELERLMIVIRKEREGGNVEKWVRMAMREVKGIKAEMSMLPKEQVEVIKMSGSVDEYEKELESIIGRLSEGDSCDNCGNNSNSNKQCSNNNNNNTYNTHNDVCMLLKQPHTLKPHHTPISTTNTTTTTTTNANTINTKKRIILLLSLLILFLITYIIYIYIYKHN